MRVSKKAVLQKYLGDSASTAYGRAHMKARLQEHFGDQLIITEINGKAKVVTFRSTVANILHDFHAQPKNVDLETEKLNIIRTASRLIKSDIKLIKTSNDIYPLIETEAETNSNFLPQTLKLLLEGILASKDDVKVASIGQAIIQAAATSSDSSAFTSWFSGIAPSSLRLTLLQSHLSGLKARRHCAGRSTTTTSTT